MSNAEKPALCETSSIFAYVRVVELKAANVSKTKVRRGEREARISDASFDANRALSPYSSSAHSLLTPVPCDHNGFHVSPYKSGYTCK